MVVRASAPAGSAPRLRSSRDASSPSANAGGLRDERIGVGEEREQEIDHWGARWSSVEQGREFGRASADGRIDIARRATPGRTRAHARSATRESSERGDAHARVGIRLDTRHQCARSVAIEAGTQPRCCRVNSPFDCGSFYGAVCVEIRVGG